MALWIRDGELQAVTDMGLAGTEPWASALAQVVDHADSAMSKSLRSVTDDDGDHYWRRDDSRFDYSTAGDVSDDVRDLALAWYATRNDRYARRAIDQIHHWFLNPSTYQEPRENGTFATIEQYITIPAMFLAADILDQHPYWGEVGSETPWKGGSASTPQDALSEWAVDWSNTLLDPNCNNIWIWRAFARGALGTYAGSSTMWNTALANYRDSLCAWDDYNADGTFQMELWRGEDAAHYQLFRMKAHIMFCEVALARGVDLYDYNNLKLSFDTMVDYLLDPSSWPHGGQPKLGEAGHYEIAYSRWQDPDHLSVVEAIGRPVVEDRMLGHAASFTHANLFAAEQKTLAHEGVVRAGMGVPGTDYTVVTDGEMRLVTVGEDAADPSGETVTENTDGTWTLDGIVADGGGDTFRFDGNVLTFDHARSDSDPDAVTLFVDGQQWTPDDGTNGGTNGGNGDTGDGGGDGTQEAGPDRLLAAALAFGIGLAIARRET